MATVTGFTAEHAQALADDNIIDAEIVADNLILYQRDGTPVNAGPIPGGGGGGTGYLQEQSFATASTVWVMNHGQNTEALNVYTEDADGNKITGYVTYPDDDHVQVEFYKPKTGLMRVFN